MSHGFVSYKIAPEQDLREHTTIENTASIYFDFNPPIVTNITQNVMVSELPMTTSIPNFEIAQEVNVNPNPFGDFIIIEKESSSDEVLLLSIFDATGRLLKTENLSDVSHLISTTLFSKGLYLYQVINTDGQIIANGKLVKQ